MKKTLLFVLSFLFSISLMAKDVEVPQFKCFILNEDQECEQTFTFETSKPAKDVLSIVLSVINSGDFMSSVSNRTESGFTFDGTLQTENRYNPFAGTFKATLAMKGEVSVADGKLTIHLHEFYVDQVYSGFGLNQKRFNVNEVMKDIVRLQPAVADAAGREKKDLKEELEDKVDVVSESDSEIYKRMMDIKAKLNK